MLFAFIFDIEEDVIKVYYYKNVEFLYQDFIDIALKRGQYVDQSKKYHLLLQMTITTPECYLLFIVFPNPYLIVNID